MAIVKKIKAGVVKILDQGEGVYTLELEPLGKSARFVPGQFLHLALDVYDPSHGWPESRCFSMQSSPSENIIRLTYAVKGAFTRRMANDLKAGMQVDLKLPYGDLFTQAHSKDQTVFIAGGTGMTPFLSLFADRSFLDYTQPYLYYGVRTIGHDFYRDELARACELNKSFQVKRYVQDSDGFVKIEAVIQQSSKESCYFISGPPAMIQWCKTSLLEQEVSANSILSDDWE